MSVSTNSIGYVRASNDIIKSASSVCLSLLYGNTTVLYSENTAKTHCHSPFPTTRQLLESPVPLQFVHPFVDLSHHRVTERRKEARGDGILPLLELPS